MTKYSFIIPVFNIRKCYLEQCMDSILGQTLQCFEIILVDDGSTNGAAEWCDEYGKRYPQLVRVFHKVNEGVSTARNKGIEESKGEYLIFVDPDDWVSPKMCESIDSVLKKNSFNILTFFYYTEYKDQSVPGHINGSESLHHLSENERMELIQNLVDTTRKLDYNFYKSGIFGAVWGKCFQASFIKREKLLFKKELIKAQDTIFNLEAFFSAQNVVELNKDLYHYRMVQTSITHKYNEKIIDIQLVFLKNVNEFITTRNLGENMKNAFAFRCIQSYFSILDIDIFNPSNKHNRKYRRGEWFFVIRNKYFCEAIKRSTIKRYSFRCEVILVASRLHLFSLLDTLYLIKNKIVPKNRVNNLFE